MSQDDGIKLAVINELNKMYNSLLEREPNEYELQNWLNEIFDKGHTVEDVQKVLKNSKECENLDKKSQSIGFLKDVFFITFDREIQYQELEYWKSKVSMENLSKKELKNELEKTAEYKSIKENELKDVEFEVWKIYKNLFSRDPTIDENNLWRNEIFQKKRKLNDVVKELKRSSEYKLYLYNEEIKIPILQKQLIDFKKLVSICEKTTNPSLNSILNSVDVLKISYYNKLPMSERFDEYLWVLSNLISEGKILDVGCTESLFCQEISKISKLEVYGIDIREPEYKPTFNFFNESAEKTHFEDGFFDQITLISSMEHFGMGVYFNQKIDPDADLEAMKEIRRILKKNGTVLITFPYGKGKTNSYRKYDTSRIESIIGDSEIGEKKFFKQVKSGWEEVKEENLETEGFSEYYTQFQLPNSIAVIKGKLI